MKEYLKELQRLYMAKYFEPKNERKSHREIRRELDAKFNNK